MAFTPVNELERLLIAAATDAAARPNFYRALLDHELLVITEGQKSAAPGVRTLGEGESIRIRLLEIQGKLHAPVFSSSERIAAVVSEEVGFLAMKGSAVLQMLRGKDVILNPGSDYGKLFPPQEIEAMLDGSIFGSKKLDVGGQKILLGQPKEYPHRLVDSLSRFLEKQRDVRAAYLAHALMPDVDNAPHTLIGIETDGDWQKLMKDLTAVAQEATSPGAFTDFIQLKPNATDVIREYMHKNTKPFYARKKWLGLF